MSNEYAGGTITVNCDKLNVRRGPGTGYGVLAVIDRGEKKKVLGSEKNGTVLWYKIDFGSDGGWVMSTYVLFERPARAASSGSISARPATSISSRPAKAPSSRPASAVSSRPATGASTRPGSSENKG